MSLSVMGPTWEQARQKQEAFVAGKQPGRAANLEGLRDVAETLVQLALGSPHLL